MSEATDLISGDALKAAAQRFLGEVRAKIDQEQGGLLIAEVQMQHPRVHFYKGDCSSPDTLFPGDLLQTAPHPWWRMLITMSQVCSICCTTFSSPATIWSSRTATSNATQFAHSSMRIPETISSIRASPTTSDETQPARLIQSL
jgi:hypothetical protein